MRVLPAASIGGLATLIVICWLIPYDTLWLQDEGIASLMPHATTGGVTRLPSSARAGGISAHDGEPPDIQALVDRILARPLFNATRRPAAAVTAGGPAGLPRLTAVLVSSRVKTVIFAAGADGKPVALAEGGRIGNYVIRSIGAGQVTILDPDGVIQVIHPTPDSATPAAAPTVISGPSIGDLLRQRVASPSFPSQPPPAQR